MCIVVHESCECMYIDIGDLIGIIFGVGNGT